MTPIAVLVAAGTLTAGAAVELDGDEVRHLAVRRVRSGSDVEAFDGAGRSARGTIVLNNTAATVTIGAVSEHPPPPATTLAVGAGDRDRFIALAERCTELGVTTLVPLVTSRSRDVAGRWRDAALARARRRALEACKQSRNPWAARVDGSRGLADLAAAVPAQRWLLADASGGRCPAVAPGTPVGWIIGPEGGLTGDEAAFCVAQLGATPVSLGRSILRFDTAAIVAAAMTIDRRIAPEE